MSALCICAMLPIDNWEPSYILSESMYIKKTLDGTSFRVYQCFQLSVLNCVGKSTMSMIFYVYPIVADEKKNLTCGGKTAPTALCYRKKKTSHRSRKPPNPRPTHTQRHHSPCEVGPAFRLVLLEWDRRGVFFYNAQLRRPRPRNSPC